MSRPAPVSVVETPEFLAATRRIMDEEERGKRGGARVVYYYHSEVMPLFALTAYAKNERANLSQADRNDFRRLTALLVESYAKRNRR